VKKRPGRVIAALPAVALVSLSLAACTGSGSKSGESSASALPGATVSAACKGTPTSGGTLTLAVQNQTLSLSPYHTPGGFGDGEAESLILQGLVAMDPTGKSQDIVGAIADKWSVSSDQKTYSFHIRSGITFSNGQPVTAADVKNSLDMWADPKQDDWASFATGYASTTVVDPQNVKVNLSTPTGGFLYSLAMASAVVTPANLVKAQGKDFWSHPVGTGPFKLESWARGSSITFAKNTKYWTPGRPRLDKVVFNFVTDDNTRVLDLANGQAQVIDSLPFSQVASVRARTNVSVIPYKIPSWVLLSLNHKKAPFKDLKLRQALNDAIDRDAINKKIYAGLGTVPNSILPQLRYDAPNSKVAPNKYDLDKAKKLIGESSFAKGISATLEYPSGNPAFESLALILQSEWEQIGVKLTLRAEDQATLSKSFTGGTYDMILPYALAVGDVPVPDEFSAFYAVPGGTNGFFSWWTDPSIASMVKTFLHAPDSDRATQWPKIQEAMQEQVPVLNIMDLPYLEGVANTVCENNLTPIGYESLANTWIAK
jgi:peptide/nickel transport system substrate-binding protein